jgi:pimeloyl-ACP methyl ester carboxylesterase
MSLHGHETRWMCAVLLSAVAGTACSPDDRDATGAQASPQVVANESPAAAADTIEAEVAPADDLVRQAVFAPCADDAELECGQLSVPVDYAHPRGPQITLATVRAPAFAARKRGVIFVNPGGPGGSGVDLVIQAKFLFAQLRNDFDVVSFDPRGTARSQSVDCTFELPAQPTSDTMEATAKFLDDIGIRYAQACSEQFGALATQIGTNNAARDIDVFRAALGERQINYLGYSYGTILGASYATLFPQRVRAMVLDGNVPPTWFGDYLLELDADGSAGAELALRRLDQLCRAADDCPLKTAGVVATYDRVVDRLNRDPIVVEGGVITGESVRQVVFSLLYQEVFGWPAIVGILSRVDAGEVAGLPAIPVDGGSTVTLPNAFAIVCDDSTTRRPGLDYLPAQTGNQAVYPRFGGANVGLGIAACSGWPRTRVAALKNLRTRNPVVLIGNDFDPSTPQTWSRNMAAALGSNATLVRYQGGGHTIYGSGSACIDDAIEGYFRDPTAPLVGLTCPAQALAFASPATSARATSATRMSEILPKVIPQVPTLPRRR